MKKGFSIHNMSVKAKITMFSIVMLVFMTIIAATGLFSANIINKARSARYDNYAMGEYYLSEAFTNFCNIKVRLRNIVFYYYNDPVNLQDQNTKIANYKKAVADNFGLFEDRLDAFDPEIATQFEQVEQAIERWYKSGDEDIQLATSGKQEEAIKDLMDEGRVIADEAEAELAELVTALEDESAQNNKELEAELAVLTAILIGVAIVAILITFIYAVILVRAITVPVKKMSEAAKKMALGDIEVDCKKIHNDDLGELMDNFSNMVDAIKDQVIIAEKIAHGDLTVQVEARSNKDVLGIALQKMVSGQHTTISNIKESTMQVTVGSEQVATASQALAQGSTEQASALQQVTASMNEIAENTKENAAQATQADSLVQDVKSMAMSGNEQMKSMIGAMNDINDSSATISKIIKTIDDIAFQTNILALNAAVEAARAGVHGKGFAVVAEEVRNLAAKSASAASETAEMIEDSIHKVNNGTKLAEDTAKSLDEIVNAIDRVVELISAIATASNDQATAVSQIDQAIAQVSQVVQTNSATSEQCAAASEELSNQAANLRSMVANYKLVARQGNDFSLDSDNSASYSNSANYNEQIISLDGEYGKY